MSVEIRLPGGFVNEVFYKPDSNTVIKRYQTGNGISTDPIQRYYAEKNSLETISLAPNVIEHQTGEGIFLEMSYINGENALHYVLPTLEELIQKKIAFCAGEGLKHVHSSERQELTNSFHHQHFDSLLKLITRTHKNLNTVHIDSNQFLDLLYQTYKPMVIEQHGLVWTHGDYWFNNIIGEIKGDDFKINGIIDWELAQNHSPYRDFGGILLSIEHQFPDLSESLWQGYGFKPDKQLKEHFAVMKILEWIEGEDDQVDLNSDFYKPKIDFVKGLL